MASGNREAAVNGRMKVVDRAVDAVRQAASMGHEARLFKTRASDAVEDRLHTAKRTITRGMHDFEDLRDSAVHRVRRAPLLTVALAMGAGILLGAVVGWIRGRARGSKDAWRVVAR